MLWRAFWIPTTPLYLKIAAIGAALYLVWPMDLIPDFIPILGWLDDIVIIPLIVAWIVSRLPREDAAHSAKGPVIDGTARRI
ncbi:YkvA family protein [Pelagibacterium lentulum]|uniref:DUF1232 domain-containing protein n=1 Tax=Pelagibacterium lentulum TaxID=2029865 RepID=A0A916VU82_9HYPH|nr:YkvA family protein [Pelagibacterium lentulum]GGA35565.1 hypothetical protein GCM10011499_01120 [Pelagibacterium lentulum]